MMPSISKNVRLLVFLALTCHLVPIKSSVQNSKRNQQNEYESIFLSEEEKSSFTIEIDEKEDLQEYKEDRYKRSSEDNPTMTLSKQEDSVAKNMTSIFNLNSSHLHLTVNWEGKKNHPVVFVLTRDQDIKKENSSSKFFISQDYGKSFQDISDRFKLHSGKNAVLDKYYKSQNSSCIYVFTDILEKAIFMTRDCGQSIKFHKLSVTPSNVVFDENELNTFLIHDLKSLSKSLYVTRNFGRSFSLVSKHVKNFALKTVDGKTKIYLQKYQNPKEVSNDNNIKTRKIIRDGHFTNIITSTNYFASTDQTTILYRNAVDFQIHGNTIFVVSEKEHQSSGRKYLELNIAREGQRFVPAVFDTGRKAKGYRIVDVTSDGEIMIAVNHDELLSNLYVSERVTQYEAKFILSLDRVMYYNPEVTWKNTWISKKSKSEPFVDVHKVEGLRGIYIANQLTDEYYSANKNKVSQIQNIKPEHLQSLITFNQGGKWQKITIPVGSLLDNSNCNKEKYEECGLHIAQHFAKISNSRSTPITSSKSAIGLIMASGNVGKSFGNKKSIYVSRDGGVSWNQTLTGSYFYNVGDHGGIIVAVKKFMSGGKTNELLYSTNEGTTWQSLVFSQEPLMIFGLLTEPGENTTTFTMFGTPTMTPMAWKIITVDLSQAFDYSCTKDDYENWSFSHEINGKQQCLLGRKEVYERRKININCHNGQEYERLIKSVSCDCDRTDYICAFGFRKDDKCEKGDLKCSDTCVKDSRFIGYDPYRPPFHCPLGSKYNLTKGYIKIQGDICNGGRSSRFEPKEMNCPAKEDKEFLLVSERSQITQINLRNSSEVRNLPLPKIKNVIALDYDIESDCVFYGDNEIGKIFMHCFNDGITEILVDDIGSVEGMSYDWISKNLYFTDGKKHTIELVHLHNSINGKLDAGFRKTLLTNTDINKPRGIAVHPNEGLLFYSIWDESNPHIGKAYMDGSHSEVIISDPSVQWPNSLTMDFHASRVYWVDAGKDRIASVNLDGGDYKIVLEAVSQLHHPFSIGIYKDLMYWDDWKYNSIYFANKNDGKGLARLKRSLSHAMDLKVLSDTSRTGNNSCSINPCSHICVPIPNAIEIHKTNYVCLCPNGMSEVRDDSGHVTCKRGTMNNSVTTENGKTINDSTVMPRTYSSEEIFVDLETLDVDTQKSKDNPFNETVSRDPLSSSITNTPDSVKNINATNAKASKINTSMSQLNELLSENDNLVSELDATLPHSVHNFSISNKSNIHIPESEEKPKVVHDQSGYDNWVKFAAAFFVFVVIVVIGISIYLICKCYQDKPQVVSVKELAAQYIGSKGSVSIYEKINTDDSSSQN